MIERGFVRGAISAVSIGWIAACASGSGSSDDVPARTITVKLIAFNDFHGYLDPPGTTMVADPADASKSVTESVGGGAYLATMVHRLKSENPLSAVVAAGDLVGASPLDSALFHDEPTIEVLSHMGLEFSSVGNHEFDHGEAELRRQQAGRCFPGGKVGTNTCLNEGAFSGAAFKYLAANVIDNVDGRPLFPGYAIKWFDAGRRRKVGVAFIGLVLRQTPSLVASPGIAHLTFSDEATAANALLPEIRAQGVRAAVVLIHQGVSTHAAFDDPACTGSNGDLLPILDQLDPSIRLVISGHTHQAYICHGNGTTNRSVLYTSAGKYGEFVTNLDLTLDVDTGTITDIRADNRLVVNGKDPNPAPLRYPSVTPDRAIATLIAQYDAASAPLVNRVIGTVTADITTAGEAVATGGTGESALGDVVADAQLLATQTDPDPPVIAFMNPGGLRTNLMFGQTSARESPGEVTFGEAYNVQPFGDVLIDVNLTGSQIYVLLGQQWVGQTAPKILEVSRGFHYRWDNKLPDGTSKVVDNSVSLDGVALDRHKTYRVAVNNFLAGGGDGFTSLQSATAAFAGPTDIDAFTDFLSRNSPLAPPSPGRITREN